MHKKNAVNINHLSGEPLLIGIKIEHADFNAMADKLARGSQDEELLFKRLQNALSCASRQNLVV